MKIGKSGFEVRTDLNRKVKVKKEETGPQVKGDTVSISKGKDADNLKKPGIELLSPSAKKMKESLQPFSDKDAKDAIEYFIKNGMEGGTKAGFSKKILFFHVSVSDSDKALDRLKQGKPLYIKNERDKYSTVDSLESLQVLDSLKGRGNNTILPQNQFDALKFIEKGLDADDGYYNPGFWGEAKVNSFDAYNALREGEEIQVNVGDKADLKAFNPADLAEVNALYGDGNNTILPDDQFKALKHLGQGKGKDDGLFAEGVRLNSYEALQRLQAGKNVGVNVDKNKNMIANDTHDLAEANAFYGDGDNTILPKKEFELFKYFEKGKDSDDGFYVKGDKVNAYEALQNFQDGSKVSLSVGDKKGLILRTTSDLAEADAFYGSGKNEVMPESHFASMKYFDALDAYRDSSGRRSINAYQALQNIQDGSPVTIMNSGYEETVRSTEDVHELDVMEGLATNDVIPQDQFDNLQAIKPYLYNKPHAGSRKISAYGGLQKFQAGEPLDYGMKGGDFNEMIFGKVDKPENLPDGLTRLKNQQEYDKYQFSFPEYKEKTEKEMKKTPGILDDDVKHAKSNIDRAKNDQSDEERKIDRAERDLDRGKRDLRDAEYDLRRARSMPDKVTEYGYHYGYNSSTGKYEYHYGSHQVDNDEKDRKMRRARSDISDAERKIRDAKSRLSRAEDALEDAIRRLKAGELRLDGGESLLTMFPQLQSLIESLSEEKFATQKEELKTKLQEAAKTAQPCGKLIKGNLERYSKLLGVMEERPERPEGWTPPEPRIEE